MAIFIVKSQFHLIIGEKTWLLNAKFPVKPKFTLYHPYNKQKTLIKEEHITFLFLIFMYSFLSFSFLSSILFLEENLALSLTFLLYNLYYKLMFVLS